MVRKLTLIIGSWEKIELRLISHSDFSSKTKVKKTERCSKILGDFWKFGENFGVLSHRKKGERESEDIGKEKKTLGG